MNSPGLLFSLAGLLCTVACTNFNPEPISFSTTESYRFDFGSEVEVNEASTISVPSSVLYTSELGYGLTTPADDFYHPATLRARDGLLIDGVSAKSLSFKVDVPDGEWHTILWFEAGKTDLVNTEIRINGEEVQAEFQGFNPPAEGRKTIQKMYRVVQHRVSVAGEGLELIMQNPNEEVLLLSVQLIPEPGTGSERITASLESAGAFDSMDDLQALRGETQKEADPVVNAYWDAQVQLLQKAEELFYLRGWGWATDSTGMGLFDHLHQSVMLFDGVLSHPDIEQNPLYERALWYRGRLLYWLWLERGGPLEQAGAERDLARMLVLHPEEPLVGMYNGKEYDEPDPFDGFKAPRNAPKWAVMQWESLNRLKDIADWWVNDQQAANGEFGGKFGDDVEILRWWPPLILTGDETAYTGWKRLADGVWNSNRVKDGYAAKPSDVEHSSEYISDTAPQMVLFSDDSEYEERLAYSARHFAGLWSGMNENEDRFFKSAWFSSSEVELDPPKNRDVVYNARAMKAVRYYAWKTEDPETIGHLKEWADAWYKVTMGTAKGKPEGIVPPSVRWPDGVVNGNEEEWYVANMYWPYFDFRGSSAMYDQFLFTWKMTNDDRYLEPMHTTIELIRKHEAAISKPIDQLETGSEAWAAHVVANRSGFWNVVSTWRFYTNENRYDDLLTNYGGAYAKYRLSGDLTHLEKAMNRYLEAIRYNKPMFTTEVIHTDRVFITKGRSREAGDLQAMITGNGISESSSPYGVINWEKASREVTFLVTDHSQTHVDVQLYSFGETAEEIDYRLWNLKPGTYTVMVDGKEQSRLTVDGNGTRGSFDLPVKTVVRLTIQHEGS
ncbi:MAG: hypothetical protein AAFW89_00400 [Bacteroidota bacterium]